MECWDAGLMEAGLAGILGQAGLAGKLFFSISRLAWLAQKLQNLAFVGLQKSC